jgi:hypothetical protein
MAPAASTIAYLGDDLLREVFLLLPTPADVLRAALACKLFLRAIRSAAFLRLFRRRHPFTSPHLLGCFIHRPIRDRISDNPLPLLLPALPANSAATRRVVDGADFALSFLPAGASSRADLWKVLDCRNGRILLRNRVSREMVVADPLIRRTVSLPAPPAGRPIGYGLVADDGDSSLFQAVCISQEGGGSPGLRALVLSSGELRWADVAGLALADQPDLADSRAMQANRSLYWGLKGLERMVEFNTVTMEFSVLELPPFTRLPMSSFDVIEKGEGGADGLYLLTMNNFCIEVWGGWEDGSGGLAWKLVEKSVMFKRAMAALIGSKRFHPLNVIGVVAGVLFLRNGDHMFSIELETMKLWRLTHKVNCPSSMIYPYTIAWPPLFLNPSEHSAPVRSLVRQLC